MKRTARAWITRAVIASSLIAWTIFDPAQTATPARPMAALPIWAYPVSDTPAPTAVPPASPTLLTEPDSKAPGLTRAQINDIFVVPDWYPEAHPPMPPIVAVGRKPEVGPCAHCHLPTGYGRPENQSLAGLPVSYMIQQIADFKNGLRKSSEPRMASVSHMVMYSKFITPEDAKIASDYFASIKPVKWIRVVEASTVPKTHPDGLMLVTDKGTEPIGDRAIELSEDLEQFELRSTKVGFVAYVPPGSLKQGEALVKTGGDGKTMACTSCHGPNLKGLGNVPSIAGRSPSQMTRQLVDFQTGARNGADAAAMKLVVSHLTTPDIVAITGYLASLEP